MCENVLGYVLMVVPLGEVNIVFPSAVNTERESAISAQGANGRSSNLLLKHFPGGTQEVFFLFFIVFN